MTVIRLFQNLERLPRRSPVTAGQSEGQTGKQPHHKGRSLTVALLTRPWRLPA